MINGQRVSEFGPVLGVDVAQVLTEDVLAMLVFRVAVISNSVLALEVVEGLVHMLIGSGYELLHGIEGGIVTGAGSGESDALQAVIDLEHLVGNIIVLVAVIVK